MIIDIGAVRSDALMRSGLKLDMPGVFFSRSFAYRFLSTANPQRVLLPASMSSMLTIRRIHPDHAGLLADISHETFFDTFAALNTKKNMDKFLSQQFTREKLLAEVNEEGNLFLMAYYDEVPAGYVFLKDQMHPHIPNENAMEISRLYARKSFIGKGVGKALMQAAVAHAIEQHKTFIWLGVWEHNQRAIDFYTAFGFEKFGEQDFILGDDVQRDWVMRLKISS